MRTFSRSQRTEEDAEEDPPVPEETPSRRVPGTKGTRRPHHRRPSKGVRAWDDTPGDEPDGADGRSEEEGDEPSRPGGKEPVYFRARDSIWFEPLIALMIIVLLLVSLFAYTSNWPPMYVIESESMQHGYDDQLGLINTGDLVLAQKIDPGSIIPYVEGVRTGYSTYGEYGDVLLYHPYGVTNVAPIIHRALFYINYDANGTFSIPQLNGLSCGAAATNFFAVSNTPRLCGTSGLPDTDTVTLHHVGWQSARVDIPLSDLADDNGEYHSGYISMGDNNFASGSTRQGVPDQIGGISTPVETGWIIGVARGMLPWFGAVKLALDGNSAQVPPQSWQYLGITVVGIFLAALGLHLFLRREGIEDPRRKAREAAEEEEEERSDRGPKKASRWSKLRLWSSETEEDDEDAEEGDAPESGPPKSSAASRKNRGRPVPKVGRHHRATSEEDDDL